MLLNYSLSGKKHYVYKEDHSYKKVIKCERSTAEEVKICALKDFAQALLCKKDICRYEIQDDQGNIDNFKETYKCHMNRPYR